MSIDRDRHKLICESGTVRHGYRTPVLIHIDYYSYISQPGSQLSYVARAYIDNILKSFNGTNATEL